MKPEVIGEKYDKVAAWWHKKHQSSEYGIKQIERAIRYCKRKETALDVGCGSGGRVIRKLCEEGFKVKGLDVSEKMLRIAKAEHTDIDFEFCDICEWNSDKKYDLIIAWDSIFHLPMKNQEPTIQKLCFHLNTEGILIYTFGDSYGDMEDLSFQDKNGNQAGELKNDLFGYGSIGINENLRVLIENGCKCMHLEIDQFPYSHVYVIAQKIK
jgi:trans-aconitate methyltransferase